MATRFIFTPNSAEFPSSNFAALTVSNLRAALAYDAGTSENAYWTSIAPQGLTAPVTAVVTYAMASATSGLIDFEISVEAITDGDTVDTDATTSFDTVNSGGATVPGTAGYIDQVSIALTNADSITAGDYFRLNVGRDADDGVNDTATGDLYLLAVELRDAA